MLPFLSKMLNFKFKISIALISETNSNLAQDFFDHFKDFSWLRVLGCGDFKKMV